VKWSSGSDKQDPRAAQMSQREPVPTRHDWVDMRTSEFNGDAVTDKLDEHREREPRREEPRHFASRDNGGTRANLGPETIGEVLERLGYLRVGDGELAGPDIRDCRPVTASVSADGARTTRPVASAEREVLLTQRLRAKRGRRGPI